MHVLFFGEDGAAAKAEAAKRRKAANHKLDIMAAHSVACQEFAHLPELTSIEFMPDVSESERARLEKIFGKSASLPPPPFVNPPPVDPLAKLPGNWKALKTGELRDVAAAVSGRTPETREQAITIIESALASRK